MRQSVGYGELLRNNRSFRLLWLGQVVSQMGDWFDTIAVYTIALRLTGSSRSVALIMVARFLPTVFLVQKYLPLSLKKITIEWRKKIWPLTKIHD